MMSPDYLYSEICEQPDIVKFLVKRADIFDDALRKLSDLQFGNVFFTGSGDSYCASLAASYACREYLRIASSGHEPMTLSRYSGGFFNGKSLLVAISVSGKTPRVIEAVKVARSKGAFIVGVTDNPEGTLASLADSVIFTHTSPTEALKSSSYAGGLSSQYTGYHHDVPQTKTYTANLAALFTLMVRLAEERGLLSGSESKKQLGWLTKSADFIKDLIDHDPTEEIASKIVESNNFFIAGSGPNRATAIYFSYKLGEFALLAFQNDLEEYCHTQYFITEDGDPLFLIAPKGPSLQRAAEIIPVMSEAIKARTILITNEKRELGADHQICAPYEGPEVFSPLSFAIPLQLLTYNLAKRRGLDINRFRGGRGTEKYISGSFRTIRQSNIVTVE